MGIPKFFRYISERYPCIIQIVDEDQIPEFDNCYLDMNGIIHNCSHPDAFSIKLSEELVFKEIFKYIDLIFHYIKPKKVFFMAIDGVAPRAKMNQQRGRRFRTAEESLQTLQKLQKQFKGGKVPEMFDSNCITPGTVFMDRLNEHLKYFITWKISTDPLWQQCEQIIYSGHQTPGEGEHKIMDYIRYARSQPNYDPNTRHCLYGLDADLIILGLSTHELNMTLFREEVLYSKKRVPTRKDHIRFCLLHISLLRSYLFEEFNSLRAQLSFKFDFEKIIDDWILFLFLIGNDFIPNLPNFLIQHNCIASLCNIYKNVLPNLKGYLHDNGLLNLENFQCFLKQMAALDFEKFEEDYDLLKYMEMKTGRKQEVLATDFEATEDDSGIELAEQFRQFKSNYYSEKLDLDSTTKPDAEFLENQAKEYIRAIQWNLFYYYDGLCSWSWYFPQHYAPYISDLKNFASIRLDFELGEPFRPFEQLLSVLPSSSRKLLPKCYQSLMTDSDSPIIDYYPIKFVKDSNGKLNDWEAVVRIPFINEQKLFKAMEPLNAQLTPDEKRRNQHSGFYVYRYSATESSRQEYKAPSGFFPVQTNLAVCETLPANYYYLPRDRIRKGLLPGAYTNQICLGFPTLRFVKFTAHLDKPIVRVHEQRSLYENMILDIEKSLPFDLQTLAVRYLGQKCHVFWPFLRQAIALKIATYDQYAELTDEGIVKCKEATSMQKTQWLKDVKSLESYYLYKQGVNLEKRVTCLVYTKFKVGHKVSMNTSNWSTDVKIEWSQLINPYPLQLVIFDLAENGIEEKNLQSTAIVDYLKPNRLGYCLGFQLYGSPVIVQEFLPNGLVKVDAHVTKEPNFQALNTFPDQMYKLFLTHDQIIEMLGLSKPMFSKIISKILVKRKKSDPTSRDEIIDIGLNVRLMKAKMWCPQYVIFRDNQWYYSQKLIILIREYMTVLSSVFSTLISSSSSNIICYDEEELFEESSVTLDDVFWYLTKIGRDKWPREFGTKELVTETAIRQLEQIMIAYRPEVQVVQSLTVKPELIFLRELQSATIAPDPNADFQLFDRVVNISLNVAVPFGFKGTIIGKKSMFTNDNEDEFSLPSNRKNNGTSFGKDDISTLMLDVLFDENFVGGVSINESDEKVYKLRAYCLLNISYGQRRDLANKASRNPNFAYDNQNLINKFGAVQLATNLQPVPMFESNNSINGSATEALKKMLKISSNNTTTTSNDSTIDNDSSEIQLTKISEMQSTETNWKAYKKQEQEQQQQQRQLFDVQRPVNLDPLFSQAAKSSALTKNIENLNITHVSQLEESLKKSFKDSQNEQQTDVFNNNCDKSISLARKQDDRKRENPVQQTNNGGILSQVQVENQKKHAQPLTCSGINSVTDSATRPSSDFN